ncbi:hypothetical protein EOM09_08290 [bacterium]|nr:hypothetical protein [bacterium]
MLIKVNSSKNESSPFSDLFKYNSKTDCLEITDDLLNGESDILKSIGSNVKQWAGNWDAIWDNIKLRGRIKEYQVSMSIKYKNDDLLEAKAIVDSNDMFHKISEKVNEEYGYLDSEKIFFNYKEWFKSYAKQYEKKIFDEDESSEFIDT